MGAEVRKFVAWVLPRNCQYRRPSDGKSKHLRVLVVRALFPLCGLPNARLQYVKYSFARLWQKSSQQASANVLAVVGLEMQYKAAVGARSNTCRYCKGAYRRIVQIYNPTTLPFPSLGRQRPDGSAFRRSNIVYGRQPSQPRPRNDGFHWATPRHPLMKQVNRL